LGQRNNLEGFPGAENKEHEEKVPQSNYQRFQARDATRAAVQTIEKVHSLWELGYIFPPSFHRFIISFFIPLLLHSNARALLRTKTTAPVTVNKSKRMVTRRRRYIENLYVKIQTFVIL
jgi:hypothetical protein